MQAENRWLKLKVKGATELDRSSQRAHEEHAKVAGILELDKHKAEIETLVAQREALKKSVADSRAEIESLRVLRLTDLQTLTARVELKVKEVIALEDAHMVCVRLFEERIGEGGGG